MEAVEWIIIKSRRHSCLLQTVLRLCLFLLCLWFPFKSGQRCPSLSSLKLELGLLLHRFKGISITFKVNKASLGLWGLSANLDSISVLFL